MRGKWKRGYHVIEMARVGVRETRRDSEIYRKESRNGFGWK
jgi:hypothetical protein